MGWILLRVEPGREALVREAVLAEVTRLGATFIKEVVVPAEPGFLMLGLRRGVPVGGAGQVLQAIAELSGVKRIVGDGTFPMLMSLQLGRSIFQGTCSKFGRGDRVRIIDGPFCNYEAVVQTTTPEGGLVKVSIEIFGRSASVEAEVWQVAKIEDS